MFGGSFGFYQSRYLYLCIWELFRSWLHCSSFPSCLFAVSTDCLSVDWWIAKLFFLRRMGCNIYYPVTFPVLLHGEWAWLFRFFVDVFCNQQFLNLNLFVFAMPNKEFWSRLHRPKATHISQQTSWSHYLHAPKSKQPTLWQFFLNVLEVEVNTDRLYMS